MRRKNQLLGDGESAEILKRGTSGVLALLGDGGYPYAVPLSYVFTGSKIYFHGAKSGHKIDAIRLCPRASFCVIDRDDVRPEEYTTYFRSVIAFGKIRIMDDEAEITAAIERLAEKYHPHGSAAGRKEAIERERQSLCMMEFSIEHLTGKEAKELVRQKEKPAAATAG